VNSAARPRRFLDLWVALIRPFAGEERARNAVGYAYAVTTLLVYSLHTQHGRAFLGLLWALLVPLLFIAVYVPVMSAFGPMEGVDHIIGQGSLAFPVYVVVGFVTWNAFAGGLQNAAASLVNNASVVHHSPIPLSILPLVKVLNGMVSWILAVGIMLVFLASVGRFPGIRILIFPVLLVLFTLFAQGLALLLSSLSVVFRDLLQMIQTVLMIEFFAVPLLYVPETLPEKFQLVVKLNPLTPFMNLTHAMFIREHPVGWDDLGLATAWAVGIYLLGSFVFNRLKGILPDHV